MIACCRLKLSAVFSKLISALEMILLSADVGISASDFLIEKVVKWWLPDDIIFVDELPHGATGKLLKVELREKYKDHLMEK